MSPLRTLLPGVRRNTSQFVGDLRFAAGRRAVNPRSPKVVRQARAIGESARFVAEARVGVSLVVNTKSVSFPLFRIDCFTAAKVLQCSFVLTQMPVKFPTGTKCYGLGVEFYHFIKIVESPTWLASLDPPQVALEIGVGISWILLDPFVDDPKIALWVRVKN